MGILVRPQYISWTNNRNYIHLIIHPIHTTYRVPVISLLPSHPYFSISAFSLQRLITHGKSLLHHIPLPPTRASSPSTPASQRGKNNLQHPGGSICIGHKLHRRWWHIWQMVADLTFEKVQCSQDQRPESSIFLLELLDLDVGPLPLPPLPLPLPPPKLFELAVLLQAPWESTSDRPFSRARTKFSK